MTAVQRFTRRPSEVQAMQLVTPRDLHVAEVWLRGHGVESASRHPTLGARGMAIVGPGGVLTVARLGQWLTHDLTTGEWEVVDDDTFRLVHRASDLMALVDATQ